MKNVLSQGAFWMVNKDLAKEVGLNAALLLSDLITKNEYFNEEWFFNTADNIEDSTTLTYHKQKQAIKILEKHGFLETKLIGIPAKLHFKIIYNKISNFLNTGSEKIQNLNNKNKPNKNKINNNKKKILYPFNDNDFIEKWDQWKQYKREQFNFKYKSEATEQAALMDLGKKSNHDKNTAIAIIMQSIANGWKGFFELKNNTSGNTSKLAREVLAAING